jgi:hypothetical protein
MNASACSVLAPIVSQGFNRRDRSPGQQRGKARDDWVKACAGWREVGRRCSERPTPAIEPAADEGEPASIEWAPCGDAIGARWFRVKQASERVRPDAPTQYSTGP